MKMAHYQLSFSYFIIISRLKHGNKDELLKQLFVMCCKLFIVNGKLVAFWHYICKSFIGNVFCWVQCRCFYKFILRFLGIELSQTFFALQKYLFKIKKLKSLSNLYASISICQFNIFSCPGYDSFIGLFTLLKGRYMRKSCI